jgi:hypothetical protein
VAARRGGSRRLGSVSLRRLAVVLVLAAVLGVAAYVVVSGRDGGQAGPPVADPLAETLGFAPARAPVVAVLLTDPRARARRDLAALADRFPAAELARAQLDGLLRDRVGLGERDLRPLLGNPVVAWAPRVDALSRGGLAWVATDGERLEELLEGRADDGRLRPLPPDRGFVRYTVPARGPGAGGGSSRDVVLAVRGQRLVAAPDPGALADAILRHTTRRGGLSRRELQARRHGTDPGALLTILTQARPLVTRVAGPSSPAAFPGCGPWTTRCSRWTRTRARCGPAPASPPRPEPCAPRTCRLRAARRRRSRAGGARTWSGSAPPGRPSPSPARSPPSPGRTPRGAWTRRSTCCAATRASTCSATSSTA